MPSPGVAAFIGFAVHAKLARFESTEASALHIHTLPFGFNPGDARARSLIGRSVLTTWRSFRSVGAQSTAQPWCADPLTPPFYMVTRGPGEPFLAENLCEIV